MRRNKDTINKSAFNNLFTNFFKTILIPGICSSCGEIGQGFLCEKCREKITKIRGSVCDYCGAPLNLSNIKTNKNKLQRCINCKNSEFSFYNLRSFGVYNGILKKLILKYKYNKVYSIACVLCSFLKEAFDNFYVNEKIDIVETVPDFYMDSDYLRKSPDVNINHMQILARIFSKEVKLPYFGNIMKIKKTFKQQNLGMHERKTNLKSSFKVKNILSVINKNILILDDVWTTGSTLNEISIMLKKCGADKIYLLTLARVI